MRLHAVLPKNRWNTGKLYLEYADGRVCIGPFECRGKADGQIAAAHHNPDRDPVKPFGDHPVGLYKVSAITVDKPPARSYGPYFFLLDPIEGEALEAEEAHRMGLAIHGGDLAADGSLRATEGCLRTSNEAMILLASLVRVGMEYVCEEAEVA